MIYFIQIESGHIKIGRSQDPRKRLYNMQTSHPYKLELIAVIDGGKHEEEELHQMFPPVRGEWCEPTPELMEYIQTHGRPAIAKEMANMGGSDRYKVLLSAEATALLRAAQEQRKPRRTLVQLLEEAIYATYGDAPQVAPPAPVVTPTPPTGRVEI